MKQKAIRLPVLAGVLVSLLMLNGCGFKMRGQRDVELDIGRIYISQTGATQLARELRSLLYQIGQSSAPSVTDADVIVGVDGERSERRVLSVDPETGKVREFEMGYEVILNVRTAEGKPLVENQRIYFERDYVFDETAVLGKFEEERLLVRELRRDAAESVLQRLETLSIE